MSLNQHQIQNCTRQGCITRKKLYTCLQTTLMIGKKDPGKRAWRFWTFYKDKIIDDFEFMLYSNSLRLVFPTQLSSCDVDQLFSQINLIVNMVHPKRA